MATTHHTLADPTVHSPSMIDSKSLEEGNGAPMGRQITYQLSESQFEKLYLQPGGTRAKGDLTKRFANPTPLGVASFLLCLTPLSCDLMGFGGVSPSASLVLSGPSYYVGGLGLFVAGLLEFVLGNTFPFVVFCTFGSFWAAYGYIIAPVQGIAAALGGAAAVDFNGGIAIYLLWWAFLVIIFLIASLRTNVVFVLLFFNLELSFIFQIVAYFNLGLGKVSNVPMLLKAAGAFGFLTCACGWYLLAVLLFGSTGIPISIPVGDLSNFMTGPRRAVVKAE